MYDFRSIRRVVIATLLPISAAPAMAAAISWTGTAGTNRWDHAANWSLSRVPLPGDVVTVADLPETAGIQLVTASEIASLVCSEHLEIASGSLTLRGPATFSAGLTLGGTLNAEGLISVTGPL